MFNKMKEIITKFISEVVSDIKKIDVNRIFSDYRLLAIGIVSLIILIVVFINMNFFALLKGIILVLIFYFTFFWKSKGDKD